MIARWMWWAPLGLLLLVVALLGLRWGSVVAALTETDVINHYAARYVAEGPEGAQETDCVARPDARGDVWLIVSCGEKRPHKETPTLAFLMVKNIF